jgi:uncharacterized membrane protein YczE
MLRAELGVDPWSVLHEGLALRTGLTFGQANQIVGLSVLGVAYLVLGARLGIGTVSNMLFIGPWVDLLRPLLPAAGGDPVVAAGEFVASLLVLALASGMYLSARLGAGPRDSFLLGLSQGTGWSVRRVRVTIELSVLGLGALLGGPVGLGTVGFALAMGPLMQMSLRLFRFHPAKG